MVFFLFQIYINVIKNSNMWIIAVGKGNLKWYPIRESGAYQVLKEFNYISDLSLIAFIKGVDKIRHRVRGIKIRYRFSKDLLQLLNAPVVIFGYVPRHEVGFVERVL